MTRVWRRAAAVLMATLFALVLSAGAASASVVSTSAVAATSVSADTAPTAPAVDPTVENLLPVNRWSDATTSVHSRLGQNAWDDITAKIQRNGTYPVLMSLGNSMWSGATSLTSAAINMNVLNAAGQEADHAVALLGSSLISSGILALMAVIAVLVPLWRVARGQGSAPWMSFVKAGATVGLFTVMITAASASSTAADGTFIPGRFSPGWFVVTTNSVIASLASAPAAALTTDANGGAGFAYAPTSTGELSCSQYVANLKSAYATPDQATKLTKSIPLVMSGMWEATGLKVWETSQFGAKNPYGDFMYCRLLEEQAGITADQQKFLSERASASPLATTDTINRNSMAWQTSSSDETDRMMVAWAACRPNPDGTGTWTIAPGWDKADSSNGVLTADTCKSWWSQNAAFRGINPAFDDKGSAFEWSDNSQVLSGANDPQVEDFLLTLQGRDTGLGAAPLAMLYSYVASSLIMLVVFGMVSATIIVAKIAALVMMIATVFVLLLSMWPGRNTGTVSKFFGQYVGMSLFVFAIQLVFAFLTLITSMLVSAGAQMFGPGSMISMIWTGFSPVIAVVVIHMVFKKFLKVPSPFSMSGAQQWGAAASGGAIGGALGAGLTNQLQQRGSQLLRSTGKRAGNRALGVASGGRLGHPGKGGKRAGALQAQGPDTSRQANVGSGGTKGRGTGGRKLWGDPTVDQAAPRSERLAQSKADKDAADAAARARGAKNTILGRQVEGFKARIQGVGESFRERPVGFRGQVAAGARTAGRVVLGAAKVAGAGALIVGTGGLAAPVVAAVWGRKHLGKNRDARAGAIASAPARQAAAELARKRAEEVAGSARQQTIADRKAQERTQQASTGAAVPTPRMRQSVYDHAVAAFDKEDGRSAGGSRSARRSNREPAHAPTEWAHLVGEPSSPAPKGTGRAPAKAKARPSGRRSARSSGPRRGERGW